MAEYLGVKPGSVYGLAAAGGIPHIKVGRLLRFRPSAIEAWLEREERAA